MLLYCACFVTLRAAPASFDGLLRHALFLPAEGPEVCDAEGLADEVVEHNERIPQPILLYKQMNTPMFLYQNAGTQHRLPIQLPARLILLTLHHLPSLLPDYGVLSVQSHVSLS